MTPVLTSDDIQRIREIFEPQFFGIRREFQEIRGNFQEVNDEIDSLTSSVDRFLHLSRRHEDEPVVLRSQTGRIREVLVNKSIATEDELSIL